jgi:hypothetical protein
LEASKVVDIDSALLRFAQLTDEQKESIVQKALSKLEDREDNEFDNLHSEDATKLIIESQGESEDESEDESEETPKEETVEETTEETTEEESVDEELESNMSEIVDSLAAEVEQIKGDGDVSSTEIIGFFDNMMQMVNVLVDAKPKGTRKSSVEGIIDRIAKEFDTKEEMDAYLKEHPDADKTRHTFKKPTEVSDEKIVPLKDPKLDDDKETQTKVPDKSVEESHKPLKEKTKEKVQDFSSKIKDFAVKIKDSIKNAPEEVKKMAEDEEYRNEKLKEVADGIKKSPKVVKDAILESAKKEMKEIKHAIWAVKKLAKGEKLDKEDKHALYAGAVYVGLTALGAASGGALGAAGAFAHSFKLHVGIKALHEMADEGFLGYEAYHVLDKALEALSKTAADGDKEAEEALINWILAAVVKVLEDGISQEDMDKILEGVDYDDAKEALSLDFLPKGEKSSKKKASQDDIEDEIIERIACTHLVDRLAHSYLSSRGLQTRRKDKDTMADTGGSSKGREREPDSKPPRDDMKNRFKPKKMTEKDSDSEEDPDNRND